MTKQIALEIITNVIQSSEMTKETDMACAIAQKALEKLVPKRLLPPPSDDDLMFGFCPNCKEEIYCSCSELSHCCKCGQAIKQEDL